MEIAGKPSTVVGTQNTNLILRGLSVKIQWGNKFIDLIKNGKICSNSVLSIKSANNIEDLISNGFYRVDNCLYLVLDKQIINLSELLENSCIKFNLNQLLSSELKIQALKNIGFYYDTISSIPEDFTGIVYIVENSKLYQVLNGNISEYSIVNQNSKDSLDRIYTNYIDINSVLKIYENNKIPVLDFYTLELGDYFTLNLHIYANRKLVIKDSLESENYSNNSGYKLYNSGDTSILEIDKVIERNNTNNSDFELYEDSVNSLYDNVVKKVERTEDNKVKLIFKYINKYDIDNEISIYMSAQIPKLNILPKDKDVTILELLTPKESNSYFFKYDTKTWVENDYLSYWKTDIKESYILFNSLYTTVSYDDNIVKVYDTNLEGYNNENNLKRSRFKFKVILTDLESVVIDRDFQENDFNLVGQKVSFVENKATVFNNENITLLEKNKVVTKLGTVIEGNISLYMDELINSESKPTMGIYSGNFIGLQPKLYNAEFKVIEPSKEIKFPDYPKYKSIHLPGKTRYDLNILESNGYIQYNDDILLWEEPILPEDKELEKIKLKTQLNNNKVDKQFNDVMPSIGWIKSMLDIFIPIGTIVMFNGLSEIPLGWAICDGENGTPNLVGKFIKGAANSKERSIDEDDKEKYNPYGVGNIEFEDVEIDKKTGVNKFTLTKNNLPPHYHPHKEHNHGITIKIEESGDLESTLNLTDYAYNINSKTSKIIKDVVSEDSETIDVITKVTHQIQGGKTEGANHTHKVNASLSNATSKESEETWKDWKTKPIRIEPNSYSLIFIMKINNFYDIQTIEQ